MANHNDDNRVLGRRGARFLTGEELKIINGAEHTNTACTFLPTTGAVDGDKNECNL
jgi:hypothetical protein